MNRTALGLALLACLLTTAAMADEPSAASPGNLLPNPSLENSDAGRPTGWKAYTWKGRAALRYADVGNTGGQSVVISSTEGVDAAWTTTVDVQPHSTYRLSGWIKTERVKPIDHARGALLNVHNIQPTQTKAVTGTRDWTKVEVVFETGENDSVQVNCLLGGWGLASGKAWFDDLRLELINAADWKPQIAIDAAKTGEPISKYIYGQFIEHLGRCIYGGIWAEMLQDRNFFYAVGANESSWEAFAKDSCTMQKQDPFVGEQTPQIASGQGIRQRGLGVVAGKDYTGYIWLKAADTPVSVQVSLMWRAGKSPNDLQTVTLSDVGPQYKRYPLKFTAKVASNDAVLSIKSNGGACLVGAVSLMPADNVQGMRADTLALLKELDSPVYRWPGGNFVSGYNWRDGTGARDRRPPRKNPAWKGVEQNDFGLDEFMAFCRLLGTDPYIAVNSGLGDVKSAVDELQYANGAANSPMGKLRAENGHPEPYGVKFWGIGNEMYGNWQLGHMPLDDYIKKHNQFAEALRAEDPSIKLVAVGATGAWSEGMMKHCADHMDLVSEHFYCQSKPGLASHVAQISRAVQSKAETHRRYRREFDSLKGKDIRIALDEWNYWYGPHLYGELGTRYYLRDALGIAAGLNEYARNSDIFYMANYAQTVNVIGCIKTNATEAAVETTGLVLKLYRQHFGQIPVKVETSTPLDVAAAWTADRKALCVAIVNPTMERLEIPLSVAGARLTGAGTRWQIAGNDQMAYNTPGQPAAVKIEESAVEGLGGGLPVAACSVTLYRLTVE